MKTCEACAKEKEDIKAYTSDERSKIWLCEECAKVSGGMTEDLRVKYPGAYDAWLAAAAKDPRPLWVTTFYESGGLIADENIGLKGVWRWDGYEWLPVYLEAHET